MNTEEKEYDPFKRGPLPVGVMSQDLLNPKDGRIIPTEIWYPATDEYLGQDLSEETQDKFTDMDPIPAFWEGPSYAIQEAVRDAAVREGFYPLVINSHGHGGFRRYISFFCSHLASHGYVVASPDHVGNTIMDMMNFANKTEQELIEIGTQVFLNRPEDIRIVINNILENLTPIPSEIIDREHIGVTGHSYGGWTILMATSRDERISAALPLASAGGAFQDPNAVNYFYDALNLKWKREVPILYLAAEKDTLVKISSIRDLFNRSNEPKGLIVLKNADHLHFSMLAEFTHEFIRTNPELLFGNTPAANMIKENMLPFKELCSAKSAEDFLRSLGLAHMDAHLKGKKAAIDWLQGDIEGIMADRDIDVKVL